MKNKSSMLISVLIASSAPTRIQNTDKLGGSKKMSSMTKPIHRSRRQFLSTLIAVAVAPMIVPSHVLGRAGAVAPSNKLTLGMIVIGPRCTYDLSAMRKFEDLQTVAIADV